MEMNSIHNAKEDENDSLIPRYNVLKFNFSDEEKLILEELRENLIDLAISEKMSSFNEELKGKSDRFSYFREDVIL